MHTLLIDPCASINNHPQPLQYCIAPVLYEVYEHLAFGLSAYKLHIALASIYTCKYYLHVQMYMYS